MCVCATLEWKSIDISHYTCTTIMQEVWLISSPTSFLSVFFFKCSYINVKKATT